MKQSFYQFFKNHPIAHVLPRFNECLVLQSFNLKSPILDLGCGDGLFAKTCLGESKVDVGLDPSPKAVKLARKNKAYKKVVLAKADKIPFKDKSFETVISNSVLEHIEDLDAVFKKVYRVLKPKGKFIFLVPDKTASDYFFYALLLEKIGLKSLAKKYVDLKNKLYNYAHLEKKDFWEKTARQNGFKIKASKGLISPKAVKLIDFFSPLALPDYLARKIFGKSLVFRPKIVNKLIALKLLPYCKLSQNIKPTAWCFEVEKD